MTQAVATSWRDDPGWRIVWYRPDVWPDEEAPDRPSDDAELAQPHVWASLYRGRRLVATWYRPFASDSSSGPSATIEPGS